MKIIIPLALTLFFLLACSAGKASTDERKPKETFTCAEPDETDMEEAKKDIIKQIYDDCSSSYKNYAEQEGSKGVIKLDTTYIKSDYACKSDTLYSVLVKLVGNKFCIKNSDAAKPYLEKQRKLADKIEMTIATAKSEAWVQIQDSWNEFMGIQIRIEGLGVESKYFDKAKKHYEKAMEDYKDQRNAKLHWNPEKKTAYSDIAFSKLSASVEMETSPCKGKGISLVYKNTTPNCLYRFGLNTCTYEPSLSIRACDGTEHLQLKNEVKEGTHRRPDIALENLQDNLNSAEFWNQWIEEIKQWRP